MTSPTISAVMPVYNAQEYVAESLTAILSQTRPPDEVIVVDDGSTDGTPDVLRQFSGDIRVVRQPNQGHGRAFNRCFGEARGDYVAKCDADDVWLPEKLERQVAALHAHAEIDVAFACVEVFGAIEGPWGLAAAGDSSTGVLDPRVFARSLCKTNVICPSSTLVRRRLFEQIGPFTEHLADDYEFWMQALRAGAVFYYDPATLVRYRRHDGQMTSDVVEMHRGLLKIRATYADVVDDRQLVDAMNARDLFKIGRSLVDGGQTGEARRAFGRSLRYTTPATAAAAARALVWVLILSLPHRARELSGSALVGLSRAFDGHRGGRDSALP